MWEVLWMSAADGRRPGKPVWMKIVSILGYINIFVMGVLPRLTMGVWWTLVDHIDVTEEQLVNAGHQGGAKCRCKECTRLKTVEDKWICRLGSFHGSSGLNTRDEIKARSRVNFVGN